ncbi:hypothetical protein TCAL_08901 [Tigriopus californicus]|uniref:non-specific serine/threonine protein kinase n=1 Tax=Tigriopus californicus TaxID=6832 RepID=A0A553NTN4_TIGCA|nr:hypothetical protein TCAL_08901 [Tigriopus californicus]|eukprot:TCALIF_08901-PA protein Name:"Similar to CSNK1E Casein kinase I isoform epsilon (Gallus gallus)" AED:0.06 eAED:0.06 QI:1098/0.8/0.81/1/1/1/11/247/693
MIMRTIPEEITTGGATTDKFQNTGGGDTDQCNQESLLTTTTPTASQLSTMSVNLTVPKESPAKAVKERQKRHVSRRAKSPVLSRVKDWELGAFTPKTALADNVDVVRRSACSDSDATQRSGSDAFKGSPPESPSSDQENIQLLPVARKKSSNCNDEGSTKDENKAPSNLTVSTLKSNIGDLDIRIANKYRLGRKIGGGSFGDIYLAINIQTGEEVAIKLEQAKAKHPQLHIECKFYKVLQGGVGIPQVLHYGKEGDYRVMVMELLGPSLEDLFNFCQRKFSLKTVLLLADQMVSRIEFIHSKNFIHRDIKPDNFLMGLGKKGNLVFAIDFGLAKKFRDNRTHQHIPYRENKNLTGTARYASINTHLGIEQSRRDDMEALGYIFMYFLQGVLPWQGLKAKTKAQKYEKISEKKLSTSVEDLCKGQPTEFATYLNYCRSLRFEEKPDYGYLRQLIRNLFHRQGFSYDYVFDWNALKDNQTYRDDEGRERRHTGGPGSPGLSPGTGTKLIKQNTSPHHRLKASNGNKGLAMGGPTFHRHSFDMGVPQESSAIAQASSTVKDVSTGKAKPTVNVQWTNPTITTVTPATPIPQYDEVDTDEHQESCSPGGPGMDMSAFFAKPTSSSPSHRGSRTEERRGIKNTSNKKNHHDNNNTYHSYNNLQYNNNNATKNPALNVDGYEAEQEEPTKSTLSWNPQQ